MNKNKIIIVAIVLILLIAGVHFIYRKNNQTELNLPKIYTKQSEFDARNSSFEIEGATITLKNGESQTEAVPGSASKITTRYFGNDATGDLNSDGLADIAFLVTQDKGGSGTFYYVVAALKNTNGYKTTNAVFIGDRIAPQTTEIIDSELRVNYAERKTGEPMTTAPSIGVTKRLKIASGDRLIDSR